MTPDYRDLLFRIRGELVEVADAVNRLHRLIDALAVAVLPPALVIAGEMRLSEAQAAARAAGHELTFAVEVTPPVPDASDPEVAALLAEEARLEAEAAARRAGLVRPPVDTRPDIAADLDADRPAGPLPPVPRRNTPPAPALCPVCEREVPRRATGGRPAVYCSPQCKRDAAAARERTAGAAVDALPDAVPCAHGCGRSFGHGPARVAHEAACRGRLAAELRPAPAPVSVGAGRRSADAEGLVLAPHYACDDCEATETNVVALEGHVRRVHDRNLNPAERHRVRHATAP